MLCKAINVNQNYKMMNRLETGGGLPVSYKQPEQNYILPLLYYTYLSQQLYN